MPRVGEPRRLPKTDWNCREVYDAKATSPDGRTSCEFCKTKIRWVHVLEHDDYSGGVEAGCCCASRLCFDYDAEAAERELKNRMGRLRRFVDPRRWKQSKSNRANLWRWARLTNGQKARVTIFLKDDTYGIYFADKTDSSDRYCCPERYESRGEAMAVAFELIHLAGE